MANGGRDGDDGADPVVLEVDLAPSEEDLPPPPGDQIGRGRARSGRARRGGDYATF